MEKVIETPLKSPSQPGKTETERECKTPPPPPSSVQKTDQNLQISGIDLRKTSTPDRLKVPKAFKYPERYTSPTDLMMSPVTKGLLARSRKGAALLPPSTTQLKQIHDLRRQEVGLFGN